MQKCLNAAAWWVTVPGSLHWTTAYTKARSNGYDLDLWPFDLFQFYYLFYPFTNLRNKFDMKCKVIIGKLGFCRFYIWPWLTLTFDPWPRKIMMKFNYLLKSCHIPKFGAVILITGEMAVPEVPNWSDNGYYGEWTDGWANRQHLQTA